jgi:secreted trypsin-like serine protease
MSFKIFIVIFAFLNIVSCFPVMKSSCGKRHGAIGTVFGGNEVQRNEWPWLVAFFNRQTEKFFCAGNLISQKHVLSGELICFLNEFQLKE